MREKNIVWNKIKKINIILSLFIVFIHNQNCIDYDIESGICYGFENYISGGMAMVAVPFFFFLSGMKTYQSFDDNLSLRENSEEIRRKLISRVRTLVVPYLIWVIITWSGTVLPMVYPFTKKYIRGTSGLRPSIQSFATTLLTGNDIHLWFLNRLILLSVFMVLIFALMKHKIMGSVSLAILFVLCSVLSKDNTDWVRILFFYLAGVYVALYLDERILIFRNNRLASGILFLLLASVESAIRFFDKARQLETIVLLLMMLTMYCALSNSDWPIRDRSFWIYLSHGLVVVYLKKIIYILLPKNALFALISYVIVPIITIFSLHYIAVFVERVAPKTYAIMVGGRISKREEMKKQI